MFAALIILVNFSLAEHLYRNHDYFRAISEYKRNLFSGKDSLNSLVKISRSYFKLSRPKKSLYWMSRAYYMDKSYKFEYEYMLAYTEKFEQVKFIISETEREQELNKIINFAENEKDYWKMSFFIPGSGQILSGHPREGLLSFLLNIASLYVVYDRADKDDHFGSYLAFSYFLRFYIGNVTASRKYEKEKRKKKFKILMKNLHKKYIPSTR